MSATTSQPTLIFIPDISGFTQFVNETEITHSQHIIEELLEILIDANQIGLEVSEIEGDAILFYKEGQLPSAQELLDQVERMFVKFHAHLKMYETHRICQCGACCTANNLSLKFVGHFGEVRKNQVKNHSKLFGKDVILAHRLLKNQISFGEYALFTSSVIEDKSEWSSIDHAAWTNPRHGSEAYDAGEVNFCYSNLRTLASLVPEPQIEDFSLRGETKKLFSHEAVIEAPLDLVFDVVSDLSIRHEWLVGLQDSDMLNSKITRNGASHRCVIKRNDSDPLIFSHDFQLGQDYVAFTDTDSKNGLDSVYTMRKIDASNTHLELHFFLKKNFFKELILRFILKKKFMSNIRLSAEKLNAYCQNLVTEGRQHTANIILFAEPADTNLEAA